MTYIVFHVLYILDICVIWSLAKVGHELLIPRKYICYILRFIDHLLEMFDELPPWDLEHKYHAGNLEVREVVFCSCMGFFEGVRVSLFFLKKNCGKFFL